MVRSAFILLLSIGMSKSLVAQHVQSGKKVIHDSSNYIIGLKPKSPSSGATRTPLPMTVNNQPTVNSRTALLAADEAAKVSEILKLDYQNMPANVQAKINSNKLQGKNLLKGVVKVFTVEIAACKTDTEQKQIFLFLKSKNGFINSEFVSTGLVKIFVEPTLDSPDIKAAMSSKNIHFNFLKRSYALKN